ncbi:MAG: lipoate--protein ligase family protein, partial [Cyanobacteria bacterium P01_A01_bin.80]
MYKTWRLIPFLEADGELQMKIDEWLLKQHQSGK